MPRLLFVLVLVGSAVAAPVPKELRKPDDKELLVGKWEVVKSSQDGREQAAYSPAHTLEFRADGTLVFEYPSGNPQFADWTLDTTETPRRTDWRMRGNKYEFCYRYTFREGRLILARGNGLKAVPDDLAPGPGITTIEYKRTEKK